MKKIVLTLLLFLLMIAPLFAGREIEGVIVYYDYDDAVIIETRMGYVVGEVYGGRNNIREGDRVVGNLHSYGFEDIYNIDDDDYFRIYIEDYMLDEEDAIEEYNDIVN